MVGSEVLLTVAEVSVAFAGFSSIVAAFLRRSGAEWEPQAVIRLWQLISYSLLALLFALFPFSVSYAGVDEATIWGISSVVMALMIAMHFVIATRLMGRSLHLDKSTMIFGGMLRGGSGLPSGVIPQVVILLNLGTFLVFIVQVLNVFGVVFERHFTGYFVGLLWHIAASAFFFIRLLMTGFRRQAE